MVFLSAIKSRQETYQINRKLTTFVVIRLLILGWNEKNVFNNQFEINLEGFLPFISSVLPRSFMSGTIFRQGQFIYKG